MCAKYLWILIDTRHCQLAEVQIRNSNAHIYQIKIVNSCSVKCHKENEEPIKRQTMGKNQTQNSHNNSMQE